ncbi:MAG: hypothetical protein MRY32_04550 [Rickettsiales bacterium]|nr:hypothetical protein [Rickettsiales bacterium]
MVKRKELKMLDEMLQRKIDAKGGEVLRYDPEDDPAYVQRREQQEEKGHKYGYGNLNLMDYLVPDRDPNLQYMAEEPEEHTLARYIHNRKKVYTWEQIAIGAGAIATLLGATVATGGAAPMFAAIGVTTLTNITATALALGVGVASASVAFFAGYFAFRTDIKNDVDIEEMLAKRIGRHVAANLEPIIEQPDVTKRQAKVYEKADELPKIGAYGQSYAREGNMFAPDNQIRNAELDDRLLHALIEKQMQ